MQNLPLKKNIIKRDIMFNGPSFDYDRQNTAKFETVIGLSSKSIYAARFK